MCNTKNGRSHRLMLFFSAAAFLLLLMPGTAVGISVTAAALCALFVGIFFFLPADLLQDERFGVRSWSAFTALLLCINAGVGFFARWRWSNMVGTLLDRLSLPVPGCLTAGAFVLGALSVPFLIRTLGLLMTLLLGGDLRTKLSERRFLCRPILILFGVYTAGSLAILRANFNYIDDMSRVLIGTRGWLDFSRYLSEFCSQFLHADIFLTDISPLPQLLAALLLAVAGAVMLHALTGKESFGLWDYAAVLALGLSPYFLECISYKFDAPYMALSVLGAVLPILFAEEKPVRFGVAAMLGTLVVCTTYQAASGIFPMLVLVYCLEQWNSGRKAWKEIERPFLAAVLGYAAGILVFKGWIMKLTPIGDYAGNTTPPVAELIPTAWAHLKSYYALVLTDFKPFWIGMILFAVLLFVGKETVCSARGKPAAAAVSLLTVCLMLLLVFGLYPALQEPLYDTRAMYGVGAFIALICVCLVTPGKALPQQAPQDDARDARRARRGKGLTVAARLTALCIGWVFFTFAFTYGNALYVQKQYTDYRITMVAQDLNELIPDGDRREVMIEGSIGHADVINGMSRNSEILRRLVPVNFRGAWVWGGFGFAHYYKLNLELVVEGSRSSESFETDLPVLKDTRLHTIRGKDQYIIVELKSPQ